MAIKSYRGYPLKNELAFQSWFRRNLSKFGYERVLTENLGTRRKAFPDYWCLAEGWQSRSDQVIRVEIELLSHNFLRHQHDPRLCDLVVAAEDNLLLYGLERDALGVKLAVAGLPCDPGRGRCHAVAARILKSARKGSGYGQRSLASTLAWWHQELTCFVCERPFSHLTKLGNVTWGSEVKYHVGCLARAAERLESYLAEESSINREEEA